MSSLDQELDALFDGTPDPKPEVVVQLRPEAELPRLRLMDIVGAQFERCKPWLEAALKDTFYTLDDVERALIEGRAKLWPGKESAIVTELITYPNEKSMQCWLAGGNLDEILGMIPGIEAEARLIGCTSATVQGRHEWQKVLADKGYEFYSVTLRKAI